MEYTEIHETEGVVYTIQMNRFSELLTNFTLPLDWQGMEATPSFFIQMEVAIDFVTTNADKTRVRYTLKPCGGKALIPVERIN